MSREEDPEQHPKDEQHETPTNKKQRRPRTAANQLGETFEESSITKPECQALYVKKRDQEPQEMKCVNVASQTL